MASLPLTVRIPCVIQPNSLDNDCCHTFPFSISNLSMRSLAPFVVYMWLIWSNRGVAIDCAASVCTVLVR